MSLAQLIRYEFDDRVRQRGESYYRSGRVNLLERESTTLHAMVQGTSRYDVMLSGTDEGLAGECTCPYRDGGDMCKHIWATVLAADAIDWTPTPWTLGKATIGRPGFRNPVDATAKMVERFSATRTPPPVREQTARTWRDALAAVKIHPTRAKESSHKQGEIFYQIDVVETKRSGDLTIEVTTSQRKQNGEWRVPKPLRTPPLAVESQPVSPDSRIIGLLYGAKDMYGWNGYGAKLKLTQSMRDVVLPLMLQSGRCCLMAGTRFSTTCLRFDEGTPWTFRLELKEAEKNHALTGFLERNGERLDLSSPVLLVAGGWVFWTDHAARLNDSNAFEWISLLRKAELRSIPRTDLDALSRELHGLPNLPPTELPPELRYEVQTVAPKPYLTLRALESTSTHFTAQPTFQYASEPRVAPENARVTFCDEESRTVIRRDRDAEAHFIDRLHGLGLIFIPSRWSEPAHWRFPVEDLPNMIQKLTADGWTVESVGRTIRRSGAIHMEVVSGVDWFDLHGVADFEGVSVSLPILLKALQKRETMVQLSDGSLGLLSEDMLTRYASLAALGKVEGNLLRFQNHQAALLEALLAQQPNVTCDETFMNVRKELATFDSVKPADPPASFTGILRPYQRDGLGWLHFLRRFSFGGCLADDMGLGKTVQVLALLAERHIVEPRGKLPSLVVAPRSLIFNWKQEVRNFAPGLRVIDHTGTGRERTAPDFSGTDLVLTTYGTLLKDIELLRQIPFDYVVLDEAQAIKNAGALTSKSARLLNSRYRLVLTGTPVQNHLGELWSIFDFLNPGLLGAASVFKLTDAGSRSPAPETRDLLRRALRPFILRRTKKEVATDLPDKTEETVFCEMEKSQRKLYDQMVQHYRTSLLHKIDKDGIGKSKIMILEALLRLRQAACHPGLLDPKRLGEPSAKLDTLIPQITEVLEEDHKILVFSQFTSFLSIVRNRLDGLNIPYEYLDGKTKNREACVRHFQDDPSCKLFLISLKAGGLGLNLTAAEYVFLLDPWWNPAIEAQAIDRAHRIGQTRSVFAYRLIAKDTVEEKVLQLQESKRELADSIINGNNSVIRTLQREDLELLLS